MVARVSPPSITPSLYIIPAIVVPVLVATGGLNPSWIILAFLSEPKKKKDRQIKKQRLSAFILLRFRKFYSDEVKCAMIILGVD